MKSYKQFLGESDAPVNVSGSSPASPTDPGNAKPIEYPDNPFWVDSSGKKKKLPAAAETLAAARGLNESDLHPIGSSVEFLVPKAGSGMYGSDRRNGKIVGYSKEKENHYEINTGRRVHTIHRRDVTKVNKPK